MTTATHAAPPIQRLRDSIGSVFLGHPGAIDRLLACLLARGHCLIEDVPGVGKTVLASALARSIDASFARIQLTPDLLPSDITGVSVYRREEQRFEFVRGPIFASIVLADEINRATPRTQSALLEAMSEASVSVDGQTHALPAPFMLVATQNPLTFQGTYALPENQLDRFLMRISVGYPSPEDEARVLELRPGARPLHELRAVTTAQEIIAIQDRADAVRVDRKLVDYVIAIAGATRRSDALELGLSPRGALALSQAAKAWAVLAGRDYCIPEDVLSNVVPVCAHRVLARGASVGDQAANTAAILDAILRQVPSPA
ncbi:MAG: ATPase [Planctomyces sp.]|nr:ATPase [Planctomyces sp.]MBA4039712.1 ATPase [Planctomyces sp.]MBA4119717.1 ATPase [Isosphaera sp.]